MERRTTLADVRRPPASARPSTRGSCARRARPSPAAHAPLAAAAQPLWRRGGRRGLRPPSLLRTHGRAPRARRPGSRRRHALEDPPEAARSRMPRSPRRRAPPETRRAGEIRRPARPGRGGTGTPATGPLPGPYRRGRRKRPGAHGRGRRRQRQRRRHRLRPRAGGRPVLPRRLGIHGHGRLAPGCQRPRRRRAEHARKRPSGHVGGAHGREKVPRAALPAPLRAKTECEAIRPVRAPLISGSLGEDAVSLLTLTTMPGRRSRFPRPCGTVLLRGADGRLRYSRWARF